jgi:hypothetical protein
MKYKNLILAILLLYSCSQINNDLNLYRIEKDDLYGFIDKQGKVVIQTQFDYVSNFSENFAYARKDSIYGFIDKSGKFRIEFKFKQENDSSLFSSFLSRPTIEILNKLESLSYSFSGDKTRKLKVFPEIEEIRFVNGLCPFYDEKSKKYGFIDKKGVFIIEPKFESAFPFSEGLAVIQIGDKYGYINTEGEIVIECVYDKANPFKCNRAVCNFSKSENQELDGKDVPFFSANVVVIDKSGSIINAPQGFTVIRDFSQNLAIKVDFAKMLTTGRGLTFIDDELNSKTEYFFQDAKDFSEDWAAIKINDKWGFLNADFQTIIDLEFDNVQSFHDSLAPVKTNGAWGFINNTGELVIENKYDTVSVFNNNLAYVVYNDNGFKIEGYIDESGRMIWYKETH